MATTTDDGEDPYEWQAPWDMPDFDEGSYTAEGRDDAVYEPDVDADRGASRWWDWPGPMGGR